MCVCVHVYVCLGLGGRRLTAVLGIIELAGSESAKVRLVEFVRVCACMCAFMCACVSRVRGLSVDSCAGHHRFGRLRECKC